MSHKLITENSTSPRLSDMVFVEPWRLFYFLPLVMWSQHQGHCITDRVFCYSLLPCYIWVHASLLQRQSKYKLCKRNSREKNSNSLEHHAYHLLIFAEADTNLSEKCWKQVFHVLGIDHQVLWSHFQSWKTVETCFNIWMIGMIDLLLVQPAELPWAEIS